MTDTHQEALLQLNQMFEAANAAAETSWLYDLYQHLVQGDRYLKQVVDHTLDGTPYPDHPDAEEVFWGVIPVTFAYPPKEIPWIVREAMKGLAKIKVKGHSIIPPTTIKPEARWNKFLVHVKKGDVVDRNGDIWGPNQYQQLDWHWVLSLLESYGTPKDGKLYKGTGQVIQMRDNVWIGLVGDWGTGTTPAKKVIKAAVATKPNYLVHLGDVYYSGTDVSSITRPHPLYDGGEEKEKFVDLWPKNIVSFALNSNHEMYSKARGYFNDALKAKPFQAQKGASHFLLQNDHWQIFGLDTAWAAKPYLYMGAALTKHQTNFLSKHANPQKQIILLSHHTGLTTPGTKVREAIWSQIEKALGRQPDYWYWGHIHNGIVYNGVGRKPDVRNHTKCRCVGHGAVPFGYAWGLADYKGDGKPIAYFSCEKRSKSGSELKNGFATVELNGTAITEKFFTEDGRCVWSSVPQLAVATELADS